MSLELPVWLDKKFLSLCLQDGKENGEILVKTFDITTVVPPGNNYGSCLWRVTVGYIEKSSEGVHYKSLIVKSPLTVGPIKEIFDTFSVTEPIFYEKFLPIASKLSSTHCFAPKTYFSALPNVIVLEDLKAQGYLMADRCKQLDFDHCRLYTIASATFHAVSLAVHKEQPELVESLGIEKMFSNDLKSVVPIKNMILRGLCKMADQMEGIEEYKKYTNLVRNSTATIWDKLVEAHERSKTLNALHQGDPWTTNMMFKYDPSGRVSDVRLLDFQALRYSSPVNDLVFFIWTSANHSVRENRLEELYHIYCDTLNVKLEEFNCPERLLYKQLLDNIKTLRPLALVMAASFFPLMTNLQPIDLPSMLSKDCGVSTNVFSEYYNKDYCESHFPRILQQLESGGVFHYLEKCQN